MDSRIKHLLWFGVSTAIIAGMIYLSDPSRFLSKLQKADKLLLVPALFSGVSVFVVWGYTWYRVFQKTGIDISYQKSLRIFLAGQFMNSITPLGQFGGEPVMAYLLKKNSDATYEEGLSSVFSADILNGIPVITFVTGGAVYMLFFASLKQEVVEAVYMVAFVTLIGGALIYLLWFKAGKLESILLKIASQCVNCVGRGHSLLEKLEKKLERTEESFEALGDNPYYLLKTSMVAHLGFGLQIASFFFIMLSLGYNPNISPIYFVVSLAGLANFTPTPGGSGAFEVAMAGLVKEFFEIDFVIGMTVAILFRLTTYWPGLIIGYAALNTLENGGGK